jgi:hypothetical protein
MLGGRYDIAIEVEVRFQIFLLGMGDVGSLFVPCLGSVCLLGNAALPLTERQFDVQYPCGAEGSCATLLDFLHIFHK